MTQNYHKLTENNSFLMNVIRVVAAWMVLAGHCFFAYQKTIFKNQKYFPALQNSGFVLLFLLAGFFSAYSLRRKMNGDGYSFPVYIIEKLSRIWVGLIPALFFVAFLDRFAISLDPTIYRHMSTYNIPTFFGNIFFLQTVFPLAKSAQKLGLDWLHIAPFGSGRPLWTLSIEWWIYVAVGYVTLVTIPSIRRKTLTIKELFLTIILCFQPLELLYGKYGVIVNLPFIFLLGYLIYEIYPIIAKNYLCKYRKYLYVYKVILCVVSFVFIVFWANFAKDAFNFILILSTAIFLLSILMLGETKTWTITKYFSKLFSFLASYTYSLYLVHFSILELIVFHLKGVSRAELFWLTIVLSNIVAIIFYYLFERHSRKLSAFFIHQYRKLRA